VHLGGIRAARCGIERHGAEHPCSARALLVIGLLQHMSRFPADMSPDRGLSLEAPGDRPMKHRHDLRKKTCSGRGERDPRVLAVCWLCRPPGPVARSVCPEAACPTPAGRSTLPAAPRRSALERDRARAHRERGPVAGCRRIAAQHRFVRTRPPVGLQAEGEPPEALVGAKGRMRRCGAHGEGPQGLRDQEGKGARKEAERSCGAVRAVPVVGLPISWRPETGSGTRQRRSVARRGPRTDRSRRQWLCSKAVGGLVSG
jgi:hypothetical protein